jgi:hypothetical protein
MDFSTRPRRRMRPADLALLAAGILAAGSAAHAAWSASSELRHRREEVEAARRDAAAAAEKARALEASRPSSGDTLMTQAEFTLAAPPPRIVADLSALLPPDVRLLSLMLTYRDRLEVDARVSARQAAAYDELLARLGRSPLFEDVVPGPESREGELLASVRMRYRGGDGS